VLLIGDCFKKIDEIKEKSVQAIVHHPHTGDYVIIKWVGK